ncbi:TlpA family protein disulfide reductase [Filimonas effusa]|uniref:TlpA family protein disulfide reductase n=1 Tax=Filimonas effusa TaxID=2508721 RepID=UPI0013E8FF7F|nr:TlpA disulfide reductase family protein [Filimonas effusa]
MDSLLNFYSATFPAEFKNSYEGRQALTILRDRKIREEQGTAPEFTAKDFSGKQVKSSDFKNKYILINFGASYCAPCIQEFPALTNMIKNLPQNEVVVIYVNRNKSYEAFTKVKEKYNLVGLHLKSNDTLDRKYKAEAIPQLYLIDKNRKIWYDRSALNDYELSKLQNILQQTFNLSGQVMK